MQTHANKSDVDKSRASADQMPHKQGGETSTAAFVDRRPEAAAQRQLQGLAADHTTSHSRPLQHAHNGTGLPDQLKSGIESLSGYSMDDVNVHYNSAQPAALQAHAYAQGTDIHLGPGQERHLPHEAWHVVQQKQGRVRATAQMKNDVGINDDAGLEQEADAMGAKALSVSRGVAMGERAASSGGSASTGQPVQRMVALALQDKDTEDDFVIMTNLQYALSYAGGPVVDFGANADFSSMKEGEDLVLLEHGSPGKIKDFEASRIVDILTAEGKAVPPHIAGIIVLSCSAGLPEITGNETTTLVATIASGLSAKGLNLVVDGKRGLALTSPSTGERAVKPDKKNDYMKLQHSVVIKYGFAGTVVDLTSSAYATHPKRDELIAQHGEKVVTKLKPASAILEEDYAKNRDRYTRPPGELSLEQKAAHMARITRPFYQELVNTADSNGYLYTEFEGEQYALGSLIMNY